MENSRTSVGRWDEVNIELATLTLCTFKRTGCID
jgi:hypothetical protein